MADILARKKVNAHPDLIRPDDKILGYYFMPFWSKMLIFGSKYIFPFYGCLVIIT
jgi:hypothetical protein